MDLKTINTSVKSSNINFDGNALELLYELRETAVGELKLLLERELATENARTEDTLYHVVKDFEDEVFIEDATEEVYLSDSLTEEELQADLESVGSDDVQATHTINTNLADTINQYRIFIAYVDGIIKTEGVATFNTNDPISEIISAFKRITFIAENYGEIEYFTGSTTV